MDDRFLLDLKLTYTDEKNNLLKRNRHWKIGHTGYQEWILLWHRPFRLAGQNELRKSFWT